MGALPLIVLVQVAGSTSSLSPRAASRAVRLPARSSPPPVLTHSRRKGAIGSGSWVDRRTQRP